MEGEKYFGVFIWINDDPVTGNILNLKNIVEPRKPLTEYREHDRVMARCPGFGIQMGVIGKISGESGKKGLETILAGDEFKKMVASLYDVPVSSHDTPSRNEKTCDEKRKDKGAPKAIQEVPRTKIVEEVQVNQTKVVKDAQTKTHKEVQKTKPDQGKKRSATDEIASEAKHAKKIESQEKREKAKEREAVNYNVSSELISSNETQKNMEILLNKVNTLTNVVKNIQTHQHILESKIDSLSEMANCSKCLRSKYKLAQRESVEFARSPSITPLSPSITTPSPSIPRSMSTPQRDGLGLIGLSPSVTSPAPLNSRAVTTTVNKAPVDVDLSSIEISQDDPSQAEPLDNCSNSTLVYLGDSLYGIKVLGEHLMRSRACSKDITKFALNIIEFLVTPEECKNSLTLYGEGKGKTALDENKRKALRSELFNSFETTSSDEEKEKIWQDVIVPELNNKIRGIRNNKYKQ